MDSRIILTADNSAELNKLIDSKIKQGYLLSGGMFEEDEVNKGKLSQIMVLSNNIDSEFTLAGAVRLVIAFTVIACLMYVMF